MFPPGRSSGRSSRKILAPKEVLDPCSNYEHHKKKYSHTKSAQSPEFAKIVKKTQDKTQSKELGASEDEETTQKDEAIQEEEEEKDDFQSFGGNHFRVFGEYVEEGLQVEKGTEIASAHLDLRLHQENFTDVVIKRLGAPPAPTENDRDARLGRIEKTLYSLCDQVVAIKRLLPQTRK
ncbi:unnamed protein product [Rhizopus stolonifer]